MFFFSKLARTDSARRLRPHAPGACRTGRRQSAQPYPVVTALVVKRGTPSAVVAWSAVSSFEESGSLLRVPARELDRPASLEAGEILLSGQVLDKQIVDTEGHKIIRVNDIQLTRVGRELRVVAVDVSSGAILRRVGLAKVTEPADENPKPTLIDWRNVDPQAERRRVGEAHRAAHRPVAAAPRRHRRHRPRTHARGARRRLRRARRRGRRRRRRGDAPLVPGVAARRAARREGARPALNMDPDDAADLLADLPKRARRAPAGADGQGRGRGRPRAAQLPRELGRRHHDHRVRPRAARAHRRARRSSCCASRSPRSRPSTTST